MSELITLEELQRSHWKKTRRVITQDTVDIVNNIAAEGGEDFAEAYRENFLSYNAILKSGDFSTNDYMYAIKYCSYKLLAHNNIDSYMFTFPDRYRRLMDRHKDAGTEAYIRDNHISSFAAAYNKTKLVNRIMEQTLVPSYILNAPLHQEALNVQVNLMYNANSENVRSNAASSVLEYTQAPVESRIKLDITTDDSDAVKELMDSLAEAAYKQKTMLERGQVSIKDIGSLKIKPEFTEAELADTTDE